MKKINWESVGKFAKQACEIAIYGTIGLMAFKYGEPATKSYSYTDATYGAAVEAIMDSSMYSHYKTEAIELLKRDETADYYRAVIRVVEDGSMYSHYKIEMIKTLSED